MTLRLRRLLRVALNVADLPAAAAFYEKALGFAAGPATPCDPGVVRLLGAAGGQSVTLTRGGQALELTALQPPGAPYPPGSRSNDLWFQHFALAVADIGAAFAGLQAYGFTPISQNGPQRLPAGTGGVTAFKFRDPEGHPLELIHIPGRAGPDGIDHSAIAVADAAASTAFYTGLGLRRGMQGVNTGPEQNALDGLPGVVVDVVPLLPREPAPHVELLGYRSPVGRVAPGSRATDIASSRLVFAAAGVFGLPGAATLGCGGTAALLHDPDGHALLVIEAGEAATAG